MNDSESEFFRQGWHFAFNNDRLDNPLIDRLGIKYLVSDRELRKPSLELLAQTSCNIFISQSERLAPGLAEASWPDRLCRGRPFRLQSGPGLDQAGRRGWFRTGPGRSVCAGMEGVYPPTGREAPDLAGGRYFPEGRTPGRGPGGWFYISTLGFPDRSFWQSSWSFGFFSCRVRFGF